MISVPPHMPIVVVSCADPALDRRPIAKGGMDVQRYWETRDISLVKEVPGRFARRYHLRPLTMPQMDSIEMSRLPSRFAFQYALERVENHGGKHGPGHTWAPTTAMPHGNETIMVVGDDEVEKACEGARLIIHEIGHVALTRATVGFTMADGVRYALPPSLADALGLIALRNADTLDEEASTTPTTAPPAAATQATP